jgi:uncharacterized membrane protein
MLTTFSFEPIPGEADDGDAVIPFLLAIHVAAGALALVVAPVAMVTAKGGPTHRRWGKVYYWAMAVVALTAVVVALWRPNPFLALVAVFSFYFAFTGRRVLLHKRPERGERATALDWWAAVAAVIASVGLVVLGVVQPGAVWVKLGTVAVVFGVLGLVFAGLQLRRFARPPVDPARWWFTHMSGMLGSYLAAVTAFSVVNFTFMPTTLRWLWPTLVGTPLIVLWVAYYRRRFQRRRTPEVAAA